MTATEPVSQSGQEPNLNEETERADDIRSGLAGIRIFWDRGDEAESTEGEPERPPVGRLLRVLRGDRTLRQVEADTGVSNSYLSNLESGLKRPGARTLAKLAGYYQTPLVDLLQAAGIQTAEPQTAISPEELADLQRSFAFVLADPLFDRIPKPTGSAPAEYQQFIVQMYQVYTGKRLL